MRLEATFIVIIIEGISICRNAEISKLGRRIFSYFYVYWKTIAFLKEYDFKFTVHLWFFAQHRYQASAAVVLFVAVVVGSVNNH
jgi:hypothetical protein